jgi:hypothetical protein
MRAVSLLALAAGLWLFAAPAHALSITPNPVNETRAPGAPGGSLDANLSALSVVGNTATFQLSVVTGSITGIDVSMLLNSLTTPTAFNFVTGASFAGAGIGGTSSFTTSQASFDFSSVIGAGQSSRQLVVTFANPILATWAGTANFDNGFATSKSYTVVVPEPLGFALAALGLAAIALRRSTA